MCLMNFYVSYNFLWTKMFFYHILIPFYCLKLLYQQM